MIEALRSPGGRSSGSSAPGAALLTTAQEVEAYFDRHEDGAVVVVYVQPAEVLASALAGGTPPAEAVEECQKQVQALLDLVRRDRGRVVLIELIAAQAHPALLAQALEARLGQAFPVMAALSPHRQPPSSGLHHALAALSLVERPQLRRQCAELEAGAIFVPPGRRNRPRSDAAFSELLTLQNGARQGEDAVRLSEENDALLKQLFKLESDLEAAAKRQAEAAKRQAEAAKENDVLTEQLSRAREQAGASATERAALAEQLSWARNQIALGKKREKDIRERLNITRASISWRITRPMRAMGRGVRWIMGGKRS